MKTYTEEEWKQTEEYRAGGYAGDSRRRIVMEWDDLTETPREAVIRLNQEAMEYAEKYAQERYRANQAEAKLKAIREALA